MISEPAGLFMHPDTTVSYSSGVAIDLVEGQDSKRSPRSRLLGGSTMIVNAVYKDLDSGKYAYLLQFFEDEKGQPVTLSVRGKYYTGKIIGSGSVNMHDSVYDMNFIFKVKL